MDILGMIKLCINTISGAIFTPVENMGYIIFIIIVYTQYKRTIRLQEYIYGKSKSSIGSLVSTSVLSGLVAGLAVSMVMTLAGISFNENMGIEYLLFISVALMFIGPRFICFSYSGGLLSLVSLIFGFGGSIDATSILMLVAILHLLEAVLVSIDGYRGAVPVFLQRKDGSITGGFTMQRFWPIPLALVLFAGYGTSQGGGVPTPEWWPLILPSGFDMHRIQDALFMIASLSAVLGYTDFTSSYLPKEKCRNTSFKLALFGVTLLALSMLSSNIYVFKYIAAVFAPVAHELLIEGDRRLERKRKSIFAPVEDGVKVLDTLPGGPADKMGVQPGDTVISINNRQVTSNDDLIDFFKSYITYIWVGVLGRNGKERTLEYKNYKDGIESLGILAVPTSTEGLAIVRERKSFLSRILQKFKEQ